jgi:uncharacterized protein YsxB (DUF464 family)
MIKIIIYKAQKGEIKGFKVTGHAGFNKHGKDIVCSAVSVLAQTTVLGLLKVAEVDLDYKIEEGYLMCNLKDADSDKKRAMCEAILGTMYEGFKSIQESYIKYIDLVEEEV